jgi:invasion protein IalB
MSGRTQSRSIAAFVIALSCLGGSDVRLLALRQQPASESVPDGAQKPGTPPAEQTLPGGASQLQETHGDWRVICNPQKGETVCTLSQQQIDNTSRQLVLGIELKPTGADKAEGTLILPFGLAVAQPVTLQVDDAGSTQNVPFRTCVPAGCLVAVTFEPATLASMRKGTAITVKATGEGGQEAALKISLKGFSSAFDRTAALAR